MAYYPEPVARLIEALQLLPGIGPKTAQRLSFFLLKRPVDEVAALAESLTQLKALIITGPRIAARPPAGAALAPTAPRLRRAGRRPTDPVELAGPMPSRVATSLGLASRDAFLAAYRERTAAVRAAYREVFS